MSVETHLIKLSDNATPSQIQGVLKVILGSGGSIEMAAGKVIIASFESVYADLIKRKQGVILVGGIGLRGRKIPRIIKRKQRSR